MTVSLERIAAFTTIIPDLPFHFAGSWPRSPLECQAVRAIPPLLLTLTYQPPTWIIISLSLLYTYLPNPSLPPPLSHLNPIPSNHSTPTQNRTLAPPPTSLTHLHTYTRVIG